MELAWQRTCRAGTRTGAKGHPEAGARVLRPHGFLAVETPVYDTLMYRLLGRRERSLGCDGHIVFYTDRTLAALLEQCGFEIVAQRRVGRTVSLGRLLWNIGVMSMSKTMQQMIERVSDTLGLIHCGRLYLNTGDMLRVFARRVASVAEMATDMR